MNILQFFINLFKPKAKQPEKPIDTVEALPEVVAEKPDKPKEVDDGFAMPQVPWNKKAKEQSGKTEKDKGLTLLLGPLWMKLYGINYKDLVGSSHAWCGLAMGACLMWGGMKWQPGGASAKAWGKYGVAIDWKTNGIPRGAIIHINHGFDCNSSKYNHVAQADGDCTSSDLLKAGAKINLYGGNQSDTWKVSTFAVKEICEVRWPADYEFPPKILKSVKCSYDTKENDKTQ